MKHTLLLFAAITLVSCGSSIKTTALAPIKTDNVGNKLNTLYKAEIGENLQEVIIGSYFDAVRITKGSKTDKYYFDGELKKDDFLVKDRESKDYYIYVCKTENCKIGLAVHKTTGENKMAYYNGISYSLFTLKEPVEYEKTSHLRTGDKYFQRQFVYNGKVGNSIKFMYREYVNDMARPAFTQELQYDLSESNVIGFKGLRIEVIKATNTNIEYKILSDFTN